MRPRSRHKSQTHQAVGLHEKADWAGGLRWFHSKINNGILGGRGGLIALSRKYRQWLVGIELQEI